MEYFSVQQNTLYLILNCVMCMLLLLVTEISRLSDFDMDVHYVYLCFYANWELFPIVTELR